ncbi:MAG: dockerin type I repeat-containing protein [candidate division Zixibacteria bacterium]|nr:dockerin type I repeat-containing protein [candidate division Zixibacteria bacterium]
MLKNSKLTVVFFLILLAGFFLIPVKINSQVSFTYTAPVTQKSGIIDSLTTFNSTLTNIGSVADTYDVDMIRKPPTPVQWWIRFCSSGICWDSTTTHAPIPVSLGPSESGDVLLDIKPYTFGTGNVTMRITSRTNPSLADSITFVLKALRGDANGDGKVTVSDVVFLVNYLFKGGPAPLPFLSGDANCDTKVTVSDVVYLVNYLFKGGPPPCA